ncbi:MAG: hypothetical protein OEU92_33445 [Alphaproteobacteria bacterium]|nr:hypothetical protein [Alphaproteobacteria bacterium]
MHPSARLLDIRQRAKQEPELTKAIADALGWEMVEVDELLAGEFDLQRSEAEVIVRAVAEFDRMRMSVVSQRA